MLSQQTRVGHAAGADRLSLSGTSGVRQMPPNKELFVSKSTRHRDGGRRKPASSLRCGTSQLLTVLFVLNVKHTTAETGQRSAQPV